MSSPTDWESHGWIRTHLARWAAGLLSEPEREAFEAHLAGCESCRRMATELEGASSPDGHIPTSFLGGWARRAPTLSGELRLLVREHLERCADCRRELETLGQDPGLILGSEVESTLDAQTVAIDRVQGRRPEPLRLPGSAWWSRPPVTIARLLAAAAAVVIVAGVFGRWRDASMHPDQVDRGVARSQPPVGEQRPPVTSGESPPLLALGPAGPNDAILREVVRGATQQISVPVFAFDSVRHELGVVPPQSLAMAEGTRAEIALLDHTGGNVSQLETTLDAIFPAGGRRAIVLKQGDPPLAPGSYTLRIRVHGNAPGAASESRYEFEIR